MKNKSVPRYREIRKSLRKPRQYFRITLSIKYVATRGSVIINYCRGFRRTCELPSITHTFSYRTGKLGHVGVWLMFGLLMSIPLFSWRCFLFRFICGYILHKSLKIFAMVKISFFFLRKLTFCFGGPCYNFHILLALTCCDTLVSTQYELDSSNRWGAKEAYIRADRHFFLFRSAVNISLR
jgi:hypothetical protein